MTLQIAKLDIKDPLLCLGALRQRFDKCFLLESASRGDLRFSRFSFLGFDPETFIEVKGREAKINGSKEAVEDPFALLAHHANRYKCDFQFPFSGGLVGYISYDSVRYIEDVPDTCRDDLQLPDMQFGLYTDGIVIDRFAKTTYYLSLNGFRLEEVEEALAEGSEDKKSGEIGSIMIEPQMSKDSFESGVVKAKEHIHQGDIFQTVLSQRFDVGSKISPLNFYRNLREMNPSPYMFFLDFDAQIIGASPESAVKITGREIEVNPIAGTRPVGRTPEEDARLANELMNDPKEGAEHMMLVDLARNDIGKVAKPGTVEVIDKMKVERFSHVQHLVSRVAGTLKKDMSNIDGFKATFPAGTVSGAPKIRAMEIIDDIEELRRGPYAGCVGYFSANGNTDFAITIRTAVKKDKYHVQAGAGIVADSIPEKEYQECRHKAGAVIAAIGGEYEDTDTG